MIFIICIMYLLIGVVLCPSIEILKDDADKEAAEDVNLAKIYGRLGDHLHYIVATVLVLIWPIYIPMFIWELFKSFKCHFFHNHESDN